LPAGIGDVRTEEPMTFAGEIKIPAGMLSLIAALDMTSMPAPKLRAGITAPASSTVSATKGKSAREIASETSRGATERTVAMTPTARRPLNLARVEGATTTGK